MLVSDIQSDNPWISRAVSESTVVVQAVSQKSDNPWISRYRPVSSQQWKIGRGWQLQVSGCSGHRSGFQAWSTVQNYRDNSSTSETEDHLEWYAYFMSLSSKIRLMRALVISVLLYACETWTLTADILKNCRPLRWDALRNYLASHTEITSLMMQSETESGKGIGPYDDRLITVKKCKLKWFGHVSRSSGFAKTILQGTVQGGRRRGRQKKCWENNISEWRGLKFCDA